MADSKKYDGSQWEHSLRKLTTATEAVENPLYSDGTAITAYMLKGNEEHTGTPSPQNPVMPNGTGERTENWFDKNSADIYNHTRIIDADNRWLSYSGDGKTVRIPCTASTTYTLSIDSSVETSIFRVLLISSDETPISSETGYVDGELKVTGSTTNKATFDTNSNTKYLVVQFAAAVFNEAIDSLMLNTGSTAKPYEPWGYKIPISNGQQTIDIYIGDLPLLKSLDGTAVDEISNGTLTRRVDSDGSVLPTPTTAQITMPSIPTTEGANRITIDTTVQPTEFTATWTGWHNANVKEWDGSQWD